jgi:phage-related baseplate assembly protein
MADFTLEDLAALPRPAVIEEIGFESILTTRKADFVARGPAFGLDIDTIHLEADPLGIVLQDTSYRETILRARGNDIARSFLLYYAQGSAVDHLGAYYDVTRLAGEGDEAYKRRIILGIRGRSTGGTAPRYEFVARSASIRVADAVVYTDGFDPTVRIAVFATDNNGVADAALLEQVRAAVNAETVRMVNDLIEVRSAVVQVAPVTAALTLLPNTPTSVIDQLRASLAAQWVAESGLGRDLTRDWLTARLMVQGVHKVSITAPAADVVAQPFEAVRIGTVTLTLAGRGQ